MSSGKWRPFCLGLNVLKYSALTYSTGPKTYGRISFFNKLALNHVLGVCLFDRFHFNSLYTIKAMMHI